MGGAGIGRSSPMLVAELSYSAARAGAAKTAVLFGSLLAAVFAAAVLRRRNTARKVS